MNRFDRPPRKAARFGQAPGWLSVLVLLMFAAPAWSLGKSEVRAIVEAAYPGARITEVEREIWKGQKIYEVDFRHEGEKLEAIISRDGRILSVHIDD